MVKQIGEDGKNGTWTEA